MEITTSNILYSGCDIDSIKFDRMGAEAVYRFLLALGATKDIRFHWNEESGRIHIMRTFRYNGSVIPEEGEEEIRKGKQYHSLDSYIKFLIRFDKAAYKRMRNVESKINNMHRAIDKLNEQR